MNKPAAGEVGLAREAEAFAPWFHNLHLPDGSQTAPQHPLGDFPRVMWDQIKSHLPADLTGWNALDVGCNSGFYSLELARRGAEVVGLDSDPHFLKQAKWAAKQFPYGNQIELRQGQVYEVGAWQESFDIVLFTGVFYHLRYPLLTLDVLARMTRKLMVFQTLSLPGDDVFETPDDQDFENRSPMLQEGWPKMAFVEKSLAGDPTNWWVPNHAAIEAMLRSSGLVVIGRPGYEIYLCEPGLTPGPEILNQLEAARPKKR